MHKPIGYIHSFNKFIMIQFVQTAVHEIDPFF